MQSLMEASAARTAHELEVHDYRHPPPPEEPRRVSPYVSRAKTKP
jgi:hypothetical protein